MQIEEVMQRMEAIEAQIPNVDISKVEFIELSKKAKESVCTGLFGRAEKDEFKASATMLERKLVRQWFGFHNHTTLTYKLVITGTSKLISRFDKIPAAKRPQFEIQYRDCYAYCMELKNILVPIPKELQEKMDYLKRVLVKNNMQI